MGLEETREREVKSRLVCVFVGLDSSIGHDPLCLYGVGALIPRGVENLCKSC